jgi:hypothetical protein
VRQGARMKLTKWMRHVVDRSVGVLFDLMTKQQPQAYITRFAITFLDVWQAIIILNHNYWIPQLVDITTPLYIYMIFSVILASFAVISLVFHRVLCLTAVMLTVNFLMYTLLGIAGLWYDPPRASSGFSFFVSLVSIAAFWKILLLIQRDRAIVRDKQWTTLS